MITFSLRPRRWSVFPETAASVRTLVVSWKLAAEMNESVESAALVIPRRSGSYVAGRDPFRHPLNAAYVFGPERGSLSPAMVARCDHVVRIPTRFCINLAVAGAIVMYDRMLCHGRFADRR